MGGGGTARFWALVRPEARDGTGAQGARSTGLRLWDLALGFGSFLSRPDSFGGEWSPPPSCWGLVGLLDLLRALRWRLRERRSAPSEALASLSLRSRRRRSRDFDSFRRLLFSFFPVTGDLSLVSVSSFSISVSFKSVSRNALSTTSSAFFSTTGLLPLSSAVSTTGANPSSGLGCSWLLLSSVFTFWLVVLSPSPGRADPLSTGGTEVAAPVSATSKSCE